jgi:ubiquinone/menaquinone biosynthesis C-methylase UbiE
MISDATQRFSSRVENYVRYRPGYPPEVLAVLQHNCGLTEHSMVADIAFGTGLFTRILLTAGCRVFGVEPNDAMRQAGEQFLAEFARFTSVKGTAEATNLPDHSVDIVTAAQAGHWFDRQKSRQEFLRILKPQGWLVLVWNERQTDSTPFLQAYEDLLLTYGTDYESVRHEHATTNIQDFFAPSSYAARVFPSWQEFDYPALEGRLLSSSYTPHPGTPAHAPMLAELRRIFDSYQKNGHVTFEYHTRVYFGRLD